MPKRALIAIAALGVVTVSCSQPAKPAVDFGTGDRFVPFVVDATDDVGQGDAVALTADGEPYVAYFGFPAELAEGDIAIPRPFGAPAVPGVMLATSSSDAVWQRGAVNTIEPDLKPSGVTVPFGPVLTPDLDLTPDNSNGTAVAVAGDGTAHVAWTMSGGVYHASTKLGGTSTVDQVFDLGSSIKHAGPLSRPAITLDAGGNPWIAFSAEGDTGLEIHVAHLVGEKWVDDVVATAGSCINCALGQPVGVGVVGQAPIVVYTDGPANAVMSAMLTGGSWTPATVGTGVDGLGLSLAASGDVAYASYYSGNGTVDIATLSRGSWSTGVAAEDVADPDVSVSGNLAATTSVATDSKGTIYVAYEDSGIHLVSSAGSFAPVDIGHTVASGADPSLAIAGTSVALSWYETDQQNLMIGFLGDLQDVLVANPSPSLTVSQGPTASATCGRDGKIALDLVASGSTFDTDCLVAPAGESFNISLDNQDPFPHNVAIYPDSSSTLPADALFTGDPVDGGTSTTYKVVPPLDANTYYFQCDFHPTTMTGTFVVVKSAK
jgi:hypothetical protein